jgi:hypothetical protein
VWFKGIKWLQGSLEERAGVHRVRQAQPVFRDKVNLAHPEVELAEAWEAGLDATLQPVYSTTEKATAKGLGSRAIWKLRRPAAHTVAGPHPGELEQ